MNNLIDAYGDDTTTWVGKKPVANVVKQMVGDGLKSVCYLMGEGWLMTEDGKFVNPSNPSPADMPF